MLEPWIINEIARREDDWRRGDRPQLELPLPEPERPGDGDPEVDCDEQCPSVPDRGVLILGM